MSVTTQTMEQAEITFLYEQYGERTYNDATGSGRRSVRILPWAWLRFADDGEDRKYIITLPPSMFLGGGRYSQNYRDLAFTDPPTSVTASFGASFLEEAPFRPFPLEGDGVGNVDPDTAKAGPKAIHFFGGV